MKIDSKLRAKNIISFGNCVYFIIAIDLWGLLDYTTIFSPLSNSSFIQYCDSNIGLFSFASYKVIALPTITTAKVVALNFLTAYFFV